MILPIDSWPQRRSWHAACPLVDPNCFSKISVSPESVGEGSSFSVDGGTIVTPKLLILWGMDNKFKPIYDAWVLDVNTLSWKSVS